MPFVSEAEALNCVSLRELARADVLVTVCGDNVCLVLGEEERGQERGMTQDECPARWVLMCGKGIRFGGLCRRRGGRWQGS